MKEAALGGLPLSAAFFCIEKNWKTTPVQNPASVKSTRTLPVCLSECAPKAHPVSTWNIFQRISTSTHRDCCSHRTMSSTECSKPQLFCRLSPRSENAPWLPCRLYMQCSSRWLPPVFPASNLPAFCKISCSE